MIAVRLACLVLAFGLVSPVGASPLPLAAHRAAYDLALAPGDGGKGVEGARGRIVMEFTGSACEGFATNFRQVVELSGSDIGVRVTDSRSNTFEDGEGRKMRFSSESRLQGEPTRLTDGSAELKGDALAVQLKKPAAGRFDAKGRIVFPTTQIRMLIDAAKAGEDSLSVKLFDGSENGRNVFETFAVIGKQVAGKEGLEPDLVKAGWETMARWPVTVSYFDQNKKDGQEPVYSMAFELLENGVARKLRLDYGEFKLNGELSRLDVMSAPACDK